MKKNSVVELVKPEESCQDVLTEILKRGAQKMLAAALEAEVESFLDQYRHLVDQEGRRQVVRSGYLPEREIQTGVGAVAVKAPRVADQRKSIEKIHFTSQILPPYLRRTKSIDERIPWLYLKGLSTSDFSETQSALVGKDAPGLSASTIGRLKESWQEEHWRSGRNDPWRTRSTFTFG